MSDTPDEKAMARFVTVIEIDSSSHGLLRLRSWTGKVDAAIRKLCDADLTSRRFSEDLFVQLATDPLLTAADLQHWTEAELLDLAVKWWKVVDRRTESPTILDCLDAFQNAVRQKRAEHRRSVQISIDGVGELPLKGPERTGADRLVEMIAKEHQTLQRLLGQSGMRTSIEQRRALEAQASAALGFHTPERRALDQLTESIAKEYRTLQAVTGRNAINTVIEGIRLAGLTPSAAYAREIALAGPDRLTLASIQERMREAQMLAGSQAIAALGAARSNLAEYATQAEAVQRGIAEHLRGYQISVDNARLHAALADLDRTAYKAFVPDVRAIESVATGLKTGWIDRIAPEVSVASIARIAAFGVASQAQNPFAAASVTMMREALGDWRDLKMPWRLLPETNLRERFYADHGFDTNLVQLPEPAFSDAIHRLGLGQPQASPYEEETDEEGTLTRRMVQVYKLLFRFERRLREYIDRVMTEKYGNDWERYRCHGNGQIYKLWVQKRDAEARNGVEHQRLIHYADFREYADLITKADNWREVFQETFERQESVRESFNRLATVRLCTMHARPITKTELMLATAEITRLLTAIGDIDDEAD